MNEPLHLTQIGIDQLANRLIPIVRYQSIHLTELSCLSPRLGNALLKTLIKRKRLDSTSSNDHFLSLFNSPTRKTVNNK